jgi:hypothetical protein
VVLAVDADNTYQISYRPHRALHTPFLLVGAQLRRLAAYRTGEHDDKPAGVTSRGASRCLRRDIDGESFSRRRNVEIRDLTLNIFDCQRQVCGRIVGVRDPKKREGNCGRTIVWGLVKSGSNEWTDGWIFDPDKNATYNLSATLHADGHLYARIYRDIPLFGRTEVLTRIAPRSLAGWC